MINVRFPRRLKIILGLLAWSVTPIAALADASTLERARYDSLFPFHVDVCAATRIHKLGADAGSIGGHAVMWMQGACRDRAAAYPRLKLCDPLARAAAGSESGAGISVDDSLRNVNWLAYGDWNLFFKGDLADDEPLTAASIRATRAKTVSDGVYRDVHVHAEAYAERAKLAYDTAEFLADEGYGTNYALNAGRSVFCSRLPVTREMMGVMIDHLNAVNARYHRSEGYAFNGIGDNCTHLLHNTLAAAGVIAPLEIDQPFVDALPNFVSPVTEFVRVARLSQAEGFSPLAILKNHRQLSTLEKYGWLPFQHGGVTQAIPIHSFRNEVYAPESASRGIELSPALRLTWSMWRHPAWWPLATALFFGMDSPSLQSEFSSAVHRPASAELEANFKLYRERYSEALTQLNAVDAENIPQPAGLRLRAYLESQLADVNRKVIALRDARKGSEKIP